MRVVIFQQHPLDILPPLISLMRILRKMDIDVWYVGLTKTTAATRILEEIAVPCCLYLRTAVRFREHPFIRLWQKLTSPVCHWVFRRWAWKRIEPLLAGSDDAILWAHSMNSASVLGNRALRLGHRYVVTLYDLGDEYGRDLPGFDIKALYETATIVECEYNRAHILMAEKGLMRLPFVLPNKPFAHPRNRNLDVADVVARKAIERWRGRKVFLYQGALQSDRGDLFKIIRWLCEALPEVVVAVMGQKNEVIDQLLDRYDNFSFVPFVSPPRHLEVTSHAHVGIAVYKGGAIYGLSPLNSVYCAPNKIFEYTGFGIPILCNDIPGLRYTIGLADAGICLEDISRETVCAAAKKMMAEHDFYSDNATRFFESVDMIRLVGKILDYSRA